MQDRNGGAVGAEPQNLVTNTCYSMNFNDIIIFLSLILNYDLLVYFAENKKNSLLF